MDDERSFFFGKSTTTLHYVFFSLSGNGYTYTQKILLHIQKFSTKVQKIGDGVFIVGAARDRPPFANHRLPSLQKRSR